MTVESRLQRLEDRTAALEDYMSGSLNGRSWERSVRGRVHSLMGTAAARRALTADDARRFSRGEKLTVAGVALLGLLIQLATLALALTHA